MDEQKLVNERCLWETFVYVEGVCLIKKLRMVKPLGFVVSLNSIINTRTGPHLP